MLEKSISYTVNSALPIIVAAVTTKAAALQFTVSEASTLLVTVDAKTTGRQVGTKCVTQTGSTKRKRACTRYVKLGSFTRPLNAGANTIKLPTEINGKRLGKGSYRLTLTATDATGRRSTARTLTLTISK